MSDKPASGLWAMPLVCLILGSLNIHYAELGWQLAMGSLLLFIGGLGLGIWLAGQDK